MAAADAEDKVIHKKDKRKASMVTAWMLFIVLNKFIKGSVVDGIKPSR